MESAGLRRRHREENPPTAAALPQEPQNNPASTTTKSSSRRKPNALSRKRRSSPLPRSIAAGYTPPTFTINLSHPPCHRYDHVASTLKPALASINFDRLFAEAITLILPRNVATSSRLTGFTTSLLRALSRLFLRRVYCSEETAELRGISRATGLEMDLLVTFNVVLDLLMGCTSGGVLMQSFDPDEPSHMPRNGGTAGAGFGEPGGERETRPRLVHFRTLDWAMDELRRLVVELEFVRFAGGPVVARTVGYFGHVGVLTGVREGLSVSLNFRAGPLATGSERDWKRRWAVGWHLAMVLLGRRRGVTSVLRGYLLGEGDLQKKRRWAWLMRKREEKGYVEMDGGSSGLPGIDGILESLAYSPSTAAYLIFCTPSRVYSVEKGYRTASVQSSGEFLTTCNHDVADEPDPSRIHAAAQNVASQTMAEIIDESFERKQAVKEIWKQRLRLRNRPQKQLSDQAGGVNLDDVLRMLGHEYITYGGTHYAVVMDPEHGEILWRRVYRTEDLRDQEHIETGDA
jgi:hypothetical protein